MLHCDVTRPLEWLKHRPSDDIGIASCVVAGVFVALSGRTCQVEKLAFGTRPSESRRGRGPSTIKFEAKSRCSCDVPMGAYASKDSAHETLWHAGHAVYSSLLYEADLRLPQKNVLCVAGALATIATFMSTLQWVRRDIVM